MFLVHLLVHQCVQVRMYCAAIEASMMVKNVLLLCLSYVSNWYLLALVFFLPMHTDVFNCVMSNVVAVELADHFPSKLRTHREISLPFLYITEV